MTSLGCSATLVRCGLSVALALLGTDSAMAECAQGDRDTESAAFRQGISKFRDGDTAGAVKIWQGLLETLGAECGWKVLFNLGRGYERLGNPTRAIASYQAFLKAAAKQSKLSATEQKIQTVARESVVALEAKVRSYLCCGTGKRRGLGTYWNE